MKTCIYTKTKFETADGEHVLQNFLGARWISHDISCNEVQQKFGETIDSALEEGLRLFRNLLGTKGGRGGDGPTLKNVEDSSGNKYHLQPGGVPFLAKPVITTKEELDDGRHMLHVKFGDMKQLGWAIATLRNQFPNAKLDVEELRGKSMAEKEYVRDKVRLRAGICGGREYFRGLLKAAFNLLGANAINIALYPCFDALRTYILDGIGDDKSHIRWLATSDRLAIANLGPFDHFVAVFSCGKTVDGLVQFFGGISHIVRLSDSYDGPEFCFGYQVNPLRDSDPAEMRTPVFNSNELPRFDEGHISRGPARAVYNALFSRFMEDYDAWANKGEIGRIVDEVLTPHEGEILSKEMVSELVEEVTKFLASRMQLE